MTPGVQPGTLLGGTYRIVRRIGGGGMGEVYEATHERLSHRYAVKFLHPSVREHPEALPRFMREAQVTSRLRHPGIVSVVDFNTLPGGQAYLVMEYLEGESLGKLLRRTGPMPLARVVDITDQLSSALTAAHLQGVVHRDMHPQNVFVIPGSGGQSERIKVLDFGISKIVSISQKITGMAAVMGTPQYMSPEQAEGKADELDSASDQFSLAAIVYELLTGRQAFSGETLASVAYQIVHAQPVALRTFRPELPVELENVVSRGLSKSKRDRFPSVSEFAVHLRWTATLPPIEVGPSTAAVQSAPTTVGFDAEETTAVSKLPSDMAAVLRDSTSGLSWPNHGPVLGGEEAHEVHESIDDQLTVVSASGSRTPPPSDDVRPAREPGDGELTVFHELTILGNPVRRRAGIAGAVVAGALVITAIVVGVVRMRRPPTAPAPEPAAAAAPAAAEPAPGAAGRAREPEAARREPITAAVAPAPGAADGGAALAGPPARAAAEDAPTPAMPDPPIEASGPEKPPPRSRGHVAGQAKRPAAAARTDVKVAPTGECRITVGTYPWSELWVDGADTGQQTPVVGLPIACGPHRLEFKRRDLRINQVENVTVNEGREFKRQYELQGSGVDD
jgi:eukaryotic-like serine/threonine-protein kinase